MCDWMKAGSPYSNYGGINELYSLHLQSTLPPGAAQKARPRPLNKQQWQDTGRNPEKEETEHHT